jgi:transposase
VFAELLERVGHELIVGHAAQIRAAAVRKQKHDRADADLILELLCEGRFPQVWKQAAQPSPAVEE